MKKLLSIDGGGIRGIIPSLILSELEKKLGSPIYEHFDLLAGNSTGGILVLGLAYGLSSKECVNFYKKDGPLIFGNSFLHSLKTGFGLWGTRYASDNIEDSLEKTFGKIKISQAKQKVMVTTFDYTDYNTLIFRSWEHDISFKDAARATSAAPVYFLPHLCENNLLVDGGLFANNPSMCGLIELLKLFPNDDYLVISLGSGFKTSVQKNPWNYGLSGWGLPVLNILLDAASIITDYQLKELLPKDRYYRINPLMDNNIGMDDADQKSMKIMIEDTEKFIEKNQELLDKITNLIHGK